jgi:hypothetical protein
VIGRNWNVSLVQVCMHNEEIAEGWYTMIYMRRFSVNKNLIYTKSTHNKAKSLWTIRSPTY